MARTRERVRLEDGLKLSLPRLMRQKIITPGAATSPKFIQWTNSYTQERVAFVSIETDLRGESDGWMKINPAAGGQHIALTSCPRPFGGRQWYFICPVRGTKALTLWKPPGAKHFASRQTWGRQVAYGSQFQASYERALKTAQSLRFRLGGPNWETIDDFLPPKPKGMRWPTYDRLCQKIERAEATANHRLAYFANKLMRLS